MAYEISKPKLKEKKENYKDNKSFSIDTHNYSWEKDKKGSMKVSLGNTTDTGWYWSGNQNDLNGFLFRLNHSTEKDKFLEDVKEENINFVQIKPQLIKSVERGNGLYEMSGDNIVWHFGEQDDVDENYEMEESGLTKEQKDNIYTEYMPITYEEFAKKNSKNYKEQMKKAINESDSYEEFMEKQNEISQELIEERMNENNLKFIEAINKIKGKK
jgi:hypothetical protein